MTELILKTIVLSSLSPFITYIFHWKISLQCPTRLPPSAAGPILFRVCVAQETVSKILQFSSQGKNCDLSMAVTGNSSSELSFSTVLALIQQQNKTEKGREPQSVATPVPQSELSPTAYHSLGIHKLSIFPSNLQTSNVILFSHQLNLEQQPLRPHRNKTWWQTKQNIFAAVLV